MDTRVLTAVHSGDPAAFDGLALEAFHWQWDRSPALRRLAARQGLSREDVDTWEKVPLVPTLAFRSLDLATVPDPAETFRSSGTTQEERSLHRHGFPALYRAVIDATFPQVALPAPAPVPMLSLIPPRAEAPESSLSFLADHVMGQYGDSDSAWGFGRRGVDFVPARTWLGAAQRHRRPVLILATAFALVALLDLLERRGLRFRLPPGSALFETGGTKGRSREIPRAELLAAVEDRLALPQGRVLREYGMTELTSHFYTAALAGGDPDLFLPPPWTRVRVLDPEDLRPLPAGEVGVLAIFDLANLSSALHVLTEDLGAAAGDGFRLLGRARGAGLRGCSLLAEEMAGAGPA